jgi:hypothetical protein
MFCMVTYSTIYPKTHASSLHVIWLPDVLLVGKVKKPWDKLPMIIYLIFMICLVLSMKNKYFVNSKFTKKSLKHVNFWYGTVFRIIDKD